MLKLLLSLESALMLVERMNCTEEEPVETLLTEMVVEAAVIPILAFIGGVGKIYVFVNSFVLRCL